MENLIRNRILLFFQIQHKSGALSLKSTEKDKVNKLENNTDHMMETESTQEDSTLVRGRGTSIYEKMSKEQMIQAGRTQFNKVHSL